MGDCNSRCIKIAARLAGNRSSIKDMMNLIIDKTSNN